MFVSVGELHTYNVDDSHYVKDSNRRSHNAWAVPAPFNPQCFINGLQYLEGGGTPQIS